MDKSIFQLTEQDAAAQQKEGISFNQLRDLWLKAGKPKDPQSVVDFLTTKAGLSDEQVVDLFRETLGVRIETGGFDDGDVSLDPKSADKIEKYLGSLSRQELQQLAAQIKQVKPLSAEERAKREQGQQALRR